MKKLFLLDNEDSFTYNLSHYLTDLDVAVITRRYSDTTHSEIKGCDAIVISPGPGLPSESAGLKQVIQQFWEVKPILGVCLGLQALLEHSGAELTNMPNVKHGVGEMSQAILPEDPLFDNISDTMQVGLYHSWAVHERDVPSDWETLAVMNSWVMAAKHRTFPIYGVQFHPESVLTPQGKTLLKNWLSTF